MIYMYMYVHVCLNTDVVMYQCVFHVHVLYMHGIARCYYKYGRNVLIVRLLTCIFFVIGRLRMKRMCWFV